ncbi:hypothetical protein [Laribacter hongkongensis]|uniref:hypothetical protein n=1 Tax=Laribacter hongkongensis TaxID=168471 RepID=UPI00040AEA9B|nr:hypothetical protein [Laribacter hongkongensis]
MPQVSVGLTNLQGFELAQRAAKLLASSTLVPKEYQGNLPNCVIALNMAQRVGADPLMVMQNLVIVHGRPTWSAQFLIATVNTCGRFSALRFEFFGERNTDEWGCRAWAIEKATGEKLVGSDVTIGIAKKEGWYGKNGSKWQSIPQQMLMYRAGGWWTRAFAPELSMGLQTADEAGDIYDATPDASGTYSVSMDDLHRTEASIEQQAAQEAPASAAPVDVDPRTGEVIGKDEADHSPDELGLQDALAALKDGDLAVAQDIARGLSETDRAIVDQAIENKRTTRRRPAAGLDLE